VGLALAAHLASGGQAPDIAILVALTALMSMAAAVLGRLRMKGWIVLLVSALAQQVLHLALNGLGGVSGRTAAQHGHQEFAVQVSEADWNPGQQSMELMIDLHAAAAVVIMLLVTNRGKVVTALAARGRHSGVERAPDNADG
jgi:hypothetical protein